MAIYVLKRDDKRQLFDAHKINQWAKWADVSGEHWSEVVLQLKGRIRDGITTDDIQNNLIQICIDEEPKLPQVAARLLMGKIYKELELNGVNKHDFVSAVDTLNSLGMWEYSSLDQDELETLGKAIDHSKDLTYSYASVRQFYDKYAIKVDGKVVETPQIAFMGIAIKLMAGSPVEEIIKFYQLLSDQVLNLPTPTLNGARTPLQPSPSCVVISGGDTVDSIGAALHSAYTYTAARGGIGIEFSVRAEGEPVKGGRVAHSGKNSIYRHTLASVNTLTQVTRGGSACVTYTCLDPEVEDLLTLKMQRTADSYRIDHLDYSLSVNNAFLRCVARNEPWLLASVRYAPKLHEAYYSGCEETFDKEYMNVWDEYLTEGTDLNKYGKVVSAREVILKFISARAETGRNYLHFVDNANKYKPFIDEDKVRLSNLCQEISLPTEPYKNVWVLNDVNADGETALCFLSAIKAKDYTLEEHIEVAYYLLKSVDNVIDSTYYPFKQVELTARKRRAVGIGVANFAHLMASKGLFYNTQMGRNFIHEWFEQHKYAILVASNRLAKERGRVQAATKYHEGWLPINNYAKSVDEHHTAKLLMDWDKLAKDIEKWGVRFSTHTALMPTESSSVFSDSTAGVYPVRSLEVYKQSRRGSVYFSVPEMDKLGDFYHLAWDIPTSDMVVAYAIMQKFTDQGISADFFHDFGKEDSVSASQMIKDILLSAKLGLKSWYYLNFKVGVSRNTGRVMQGVSTPSIPTEAGGDESGCVECRM